MKINSLFLRYYFTNKMKQTLIERTTVQPPPCHCSILSIYSEHCYINEEIGVRWLLRDQEETMHPQRLPQVKYFMTESAPRVT